MQGDSRENELLAFYCIMFNSFDYHWLQRNKLNFDI
jgi:hypothetical protein